MQQQRAPRTSRAVAAFTAVWLVLCGVLALRHDGKTAHGLDALGRVVHAAQLTGHHVAGGQADFHGQADPDADHGACELSVASHAAAIVSPARHDLVVARATALPVYAPASPALAIRSVYRQAPKTSPPAA